MTEDRSSQAELFGTTAQGEQVLRVSIAAGNLAANIITWGAGIQDLRLAGHDRPLTLGYRSFADYEAYVNFFGAVAGRNANRVRDGRFRLDGVAYEIEPGTPSRHGLHGGTYGYARRVWKLVERGPDFVTLSLHDPDGTMGFPGTVDATCTYRIMAPASLVVEMTAATDKPTLCNLAQHAYFNLDDGGETSAGDHWLMIDAAAYLPTDDELVPTGVVAPLEGTPYDFRTARPLCGDDAAHPFRYDTNFCIRSARGEPKRAAWVQGARSGVEMEVWTTEPGLQFYAGHYIAPGGDSLTGRPYQPFSGFCLEAQVWPDAPNRPYFPQSVLR
ncbi:MAG: galactose mutarotase, partial [Rhizobiaceae bacterium]|nr:galactose mutarotase [Rhizobiaceae bacterium]